MDLIQNNLDRLEGLEAILAAIQNAVVSLDYHGQAEDPEAERVASRPAVRTRTANLTTPAHTKRTPGLGGGVLFYQTG